VGRISGQNETVSGLFSTGCKETVSIHESDEPGPLAGKRVYSENT
jgi:hypothetical protein